MPGPPFRPRASIFAECDVYFILFHWRQGGIQRARQKIGSHCSQTIMEVRSCCTAIDSGFLPVPGWVLASSSFTMRWTVTPVSLSPARIACWMGEAPRHLGRSDAWTLTGAITGALRIASGSDLAVGDDDEKIRTERCWLLVAGCWLPPFVDAFGLCDRQSQVLCKHFDRRRCHFLSSSSRTIRLCDDEIDLKRRVARKCPEEGTANAEVPRKMIG